MSKAEILQELPKLTKEERYEIRVKLAEMDGDGWLDEDDPLTDEEKKLIDARLAEHEANPQSAIPLEEFKSRLNEKFGR
jgi:putative addiction module component (TIGR02574 family)